MQRPIVFVQIRGQIMSHPFPLQCECVTIHNISILRDGYRCSFRWILTWEKVIYGKVMAILSIFMIDDDLCCSRNNGNRRGHPENVGNYAPLGGRHQLERGGKLAAYFHGHHSCEIVALAEKYYTCFNFVHHKWKIDQQHEGDVYQSY